MVDGEEMQLTVLDIAFMQAFDGRNVEVGAQCGAVLTPTAAQADFSALDQAFAEAAKGAQI